MGCALLRDGKNGKERKLRFSLGWRFFCTERVSKFGAKIPETDTASRTFSKCFIGFANYSLPPACSRLDSSEM